MSVVSTQELANAAGVSRTTIGKWASKGMPGKISRGKWDSEVALKWLAEVRQDIADEQMGRTSGNVTELRARLLKLQGDGQQIRNEILAGNVVFRNAVEEVWRECVVACLSEGDQWVRRGRSAEEQQLRQELWHEVRRVLQESTETVAATLSKGKDVVATRVRISGAM